MKLTEYLLADLDREVKRSRRVLQEVPEGKYDWKAAFDKSAESAPRYQMIQVSLSHWSHHRGQMTVYLRLLGAKVPATFGPSADDNPFA